MGFHFTEQITRLKHQAPGRAVSSAANKISS